jgi:hypothetical protein
MFFQYIGNVIIPTDELHHFSEGLKPQPPTRWINRGLSHCHDIAMWHAQHGQCHGKYHGSTPKMGDVSATEKNDLPSGKLT